MAPIKELILYSYYQSSASWRVRSVLAFKDIPFKYEAINLLSGEQHTDKMQKLNPMRQLPALEVVDESGSKVLLTQSLSIIQFIEEKYPEKSIFHQDPIQRAKSRAIAETISSGVQPLQNLETLVDYKRPLDLGDTSREERVKIAQYWLNKKLAKLEELVHASAGKYCVGDQVSLADICLVPQMYNGKRFEIDLSKFPTLVRINDHLLELDFIKKGHPLACPDAPNPIN